MSATGTIIELDWGRIEYSNNEISLISTVDDPPKFRMGTSVGVGLGAHSWNRIINGVQRECVLFQGKQDERVRADVSNPAGEFTLHLNDGGGTNDENMVQVMEVRHDTVRLLGVLFTRAQLQRLAVMLAA